MALAPALPISAPVCAPRHHHARAHRRYTAAKYSETHHTKHSEGSGKRHVHSPVSFRIVAELFRMAATAVAPASPRYCPVHAVPKQRTVVRYAIYDAKHPPKQTLTLTHGPTPPLEHTKTHKYAHTHTPTHTVTHACLTQSDTETHAHAHTNRKQYGQIHTQAHTAAVTNSHTHTQTHIRKNKKAHIRIHKHIQTHTHTNPQNAINATTRDSAN
jgi:hypothetical protein